MNIPKTAQVSAHCCCCDKPVYHNIGRFPTEHPLAGEVVGAGWMKEDACQIDFLLSDGSFISLAFCLDCANSVGPKDYPALMDRQKLGWELELDDYRRKVLNSKPWTDEMKKTYRKRFYNLRIVGKWRRYRKVGQEVKAKGV